MRLIISIGNPLRSDDGAGELLAARLALYWQTQGRTMRLLSVQQLTPELALDVANDEVGQVIFVDAAQGSIPGAVQVQPLLPAEGPSTFGHHCTPGALLGLVRQLYRRSPPGWIVTITGQDFGFGEQVSPALQVVIENPGPVAERIDALCCAALTDLATPRDSH